MGHRESVGAIAVIRISLLATTPADSGETDAHALMMCGLAANVLIRHVRNARESGATQESAKAAIEYMVPGGIPGGVLNRMRRMTVAIVDALYALPVEALPLCQHH